MPKQHIALVSAHNVPTIELIIQACWRQYRTPCSFVQLAICVYCTGFVHNHAPTDRDAQVKKQELICVMLVGTENTLGGPSMSKGGDPAGGKAETTAGSSSAQRIEKPQEVISFEAAKEVSIL